jgi:hypothetical protein
MVVYHHDASARECGLSARHAGGCRVAHARRVTLSRAGTAVGARATTRATDGARAVRVTGDEAWRRCER